MPHASGEAAGSLHKMVLRFFVCGGISQANVGHCGGTPVQHARSATWMLPVKMATCLCLFITHDECVWVGVIIGG